jgi:hypothetical protein
MAGRGSQTFKKRQKEQQRKEKQHEKMATRLERKRLGILGPSDEPDDDFDSLSLDRLDLDSLDIPDDSPEDKAGAPAQNHPANGTL